MTKNTRLRPSTALVAKKGLQSCKKLQKAEQIRRSKKTLKLQNDGCYHIICKIITTYIPFLDVPKRHESRILIFLNDSSPSPMRKHEQWGKSCTPCYSGVQCQNH